MTFTGRGPTPAVFLAIAMTGLLMPKETKAADGGFKLPPATSRTFKNGMRAYVTEYHELPLVEIQAAIGGGSAQDPPGKEGLADLVADLLRKGTAKRSAREIADAVDFVGGTLAASADQDGTRVTAEFLAKDLELALDLVSDTLMRPAFAPEEVERLKGETIGELQAAKENPGLVASRRFIEIIYGGHPYGHPTAGWETAVASITPQDVRAYYDAWYKPNDVIMVAVGDFKAAEMLDRLERTFGGWTGKAAARKEVPEPKAPARREIFVIDKPESTQSQIRIGGVGIRRDDPDYVTLQVANAILGGGFTSRLVEEIRVNRGLSYGVSSRFYPLIGRGPFMINTFTKNPTTLETVKVALDVLEKFRKDGPTAEELDKARKFLRGAFAIAHQTPEAMADALAEIAFYRLPENYYDTYLDRIASVSEQDVKRVAAAKFPGDGTLIVVLGEAGEIKKQLGPLGEIKDAPLAAH